MNADRFVVLTEQYPRLRIGLVGDFFLDRYLLIDPDKAETSIETGLPVYNVVKLRSSQAQRGRFSTTWWHSAHARSGSLAIAAMMAKVTSCAEHSQLSPA